MSTQYPNFVGVIHKHIFIGIVYVVSGTSYSTFGALFNKIYLQYVGRLFGEATGRQIRFHGKLKTLEIEVSLATKPLFFGDKFYTHIPLAAKAPLTCTSTVTAVTTFFRYQRIFLSPRPFI